MVLSERRESVLRAVADRIIPADEWPGAWEARVGVYIERQLTGDCRAMADEVGRGLDLLDQESLKRFSSGFAELGADRQDDVLRQVERGEVADPADWPGGAGRWFGLMVTLVAEGYYSDPGNGGNRDGVSWRMIGYVPHGPVHGDGVCWAPSCESA